MNPAHLKTSALLRLVALKLRRANAAGTLDLEALASEVMARSFDVERAANEIKVDRARGVVGASGFDVLKTIGEQP